MDPATGKQSVNGEQAFGLIAGLYDVAGGIRNKLIELQAAVRAQMEGGGKSTGAPPGKKEKKK